MTAPTGGDGASGETHHSILLNVRIAPLEHSEVQLAVLLRLGAAVVELHHGRLEEPQSAKFNPRPRGGGAALARANTSWRNSTESLCFPNVFTRDILTQVLKPPEKVHLEQFVSHSLMNLDWF